LDTHLIRAERLVKRFGEVAALDRVSFTVGRGEFLALLGPSGCGKTTLLRTIAGFVTPDEGALWIDNVDLAQMPPNRRPVNTVFQNYALFPHLSIYENVAFGPKRAGWTSQKIKAAVIEALALVGLENFGARTPSQLSGGQQQRVALARALINRPKVLLLDEPLGALDLKLRKRMQIELKQLQQRLGITFIFVTHDQEEALVMADRIAVMDRGQIIQIGSGEDIYRNPVSRFVASFIGDANLIPVNVNGLVDESLMIRPEDVMLGSNADGTFHGASMDVASTLFIGNAQRIYGTLENGAEFVVQVPAHSHSILPKAGERIEVHWPIARERRLSQ
jgi:spermidine/putrescine transport system ATP-binding protein